MENEMYEVILMLDSDSKDAHNPIFTFGTIHHALHQVEIFIEQGYETLIRVYKE